MTEQLSQRAGSAVRWRVAQFVGVNAIFLIRLLVLARLLSPDAFGLLAVALVPVGILLQASEFGMIPALVQAPAPGRRHYDAAWTIGVVRGLLVAGVVFAMAPWVAELSAQPRAAEITRVLALHPLLLSAASIRLADLQRRLEFRPLAVVSLAEAVANTIVSIALAPGFGVWSLVAGMLAGSACRLVISYFVAPYKPRFAGERAAARSLVRFGRWVFVTALMTTIGGALLRLIISRQLGAAELGVYYLATRLTFLLAGTVVDVGTSVSFPIYARLRDDREEALRVFRAAMSATAALIVPAFALLVALAHALVANLLGAEWQGAAPVLRVLALVCIVSVFGDVARPIWHGIGQPWRNALIEAVQSSLLLLGVWWLTSRVGLVGAALAWVPAVGVTQVLSAIFLTRVLPRPLAGLAPAGLAILSASAAGAMAAGWIEARLPEPLGVVAAASSGAAICVALLRLADGRLDLGLERSLRRVFPQLWSPRPRRGSDRGIDTR